MFVKDKGEIMKIDFDKFNLSQKIYSIAGLILSIVVYMVNKNNLNIAIGIVLLSSIAVFLLRYKYAKVVLHIIISLVCIAIAVSIVYVIITNHSQQNKFSDAEVEQMLFGNVQSEQPSMTPTTTTQQQQSSRDAELDNILFGKNQSQQPDLSSLSKEQLLARKQQLESQINSQSPQFAIGYTKADVRRIQGTPTSIISNMWFYGYDYVTFDNRGRVKEYSNSSGKLKIK